MKNICIIQLMLIILVNVVTQHINASSTAPAQDSVVPTTNVAITTDSPKNALDTALEEQKVLFAAIESFKKIYVDVKIQWNKASPALKHEAADKVDVITKSINTIITLYKENKKELYPLLKNIPLKLKEIIASTQPDEVNHPLAYELKILNWFITHEVPQ